MGVSAITSRAPRGFSATQDRDAATFAQYASHISFEIKRVLEEAGLTQKDLGAQLGLSTGSGISLMISGGKELSLEHAKKLDQNHHTTSLGVSFETLVRERDAKPRRRKAGTPRRIEYDVFLAAPMASTQGKYTELHEGIIEVRRALELHGLAVYCAADDIAKTSDFDTQEIAYLTNWNAIQLCRELVLYLPIEQTGPTPSSIWVEVGMALALGMSCTFFVPKQQDLPYVVQRACEIPVTKKKIVEVFLTGSDPRMAADRIRKNGPQILAGAAT